MIKEDELRRTKMLKNQKVTNTHNRIFISVPESEDANLDCVPNIHGVVEENCILVLDDDRSFRLLLKQLLEGHGYKVIEATNHLEATQLVEIHNPACAIVDYRLPGMDGISWITKLREHGNTIPVVFVSGAWCDKRTFDWLRNILKVSLVVKKPIEPDAFLSSIEYIAPLRKLQEQEKASLLVSEQEIDNFDYLLDRCSSEEALKEVDQILDSNKIGERARTQLLNIRKVLVTQRALSIAKQSYLKELPVMWGQFIELFRSFNAERESDELYSQSVMAVHKLKGASGSYGLSEFSKKAEVIELELSSLQGDPGSKADEAIWRELTVRVDECSLDIENLCSNDSVDVEDMPHDVSLLVVSPESTIKDAFLSMPSKRFKIDMTYSSSPSDALQQCKSAEFDAIVLDLSHDQDMQSYLRLTRKLRLLSKSPFVPIACVVSPNQDVLDSELIYLGYSAVIEKPIAEQGLELVVEKLRYDGALHRPRILCVDDDPTFTSFLETIINRENFTVRSLNDPIQIQEVMQEFLPDVVLLDVMMPGLSGYEVCRMIRSNDDFAGTSLIILTGKNDAQSRNVAFRAGANDFLVKPIVAAEMVSRLRAHLSKGFSGPTERSVLSKATFLSQSLALLAQCAVEGVSAHGIVVKVDGFSCLSEQHGDFADEEVDDFIAKVLLSRFRPCDLRCRWEPGTFVVAIPGLAEEITSDVADCLQAEIERHKFMDSKGNPFDARTTVSVLVIDADTVALKSAIEEEISTSDCKSKDNNQTRREEVVCVR